MTYNKIDLIQHVCYHWKILFKHPYLCVCHIHPSGVESVFDLLSIVHLQQVITPKLYLSQLLVVFKKVHWERHLTGCSGGWNVITMLKSKYLQDVLDHSCRSLLQKKRFVINSLVEAALRLRTGFKILMPLLGCSAGCSQKDVFSTLAM